MAEAERKPQRPQVGVAQTLEKTASGYQAHLVIEGGPSLVLAIGAEEDKVSNLGINGIRVIHCAATCSKTSLKYSSLASYLTRRVVRNGKVVPSPVFSFLLGIPAIFSASGAAGRFPLKNISIHNINYSGAPPGIL
jgi:hypothetical protein